MDLTTLKKCLFFYTCDSVKIS